MRNKLLALACITALFVGGCGSNPKNEPVSEPQEQQAVTQSAEQPASGAPQEDNAETGAEDGANEVDGISVTYYDTVRNDNTGNWRLAVIADSSDLNDYVVDFYKEYITDDAQLLGIVNLTLNTTTRVKRIMGDWLEVTVMEYQDGEEHDAKMLFGGNVLKTYWINSETGEVDENLDD